MDEEHEEHEEHEEQELAEVLYRRLKKICRMHRRQEGRGRGMHGGMAAGRTRARATQTLPPA